ncbi:putative HAT dimerization domain, ribonuclease H-like domain-containing protein [Rosa chinensis]|uniref:Putative HAT dimerization domain, ribonuclease H-like domain-containing protein n=2 Tax=Rosa chinensis TaxID=74649 RepID=A0A2P6SF92_ROSCH|nr:putative HAT dimerization domain, ribonuclease H-like domain-containing protein [Rosa chinensis]
MKARIVNNDVDRYLRDPIEGDGEGFDLLNWWRVNGVCKYPILARIARDVLAIPVSTIASESSFSTSGRIIDPYRSSLSPRMVEALICTQNWLRSENVYLHHTPTIEEMELCEEAEREMLKMPCGAAVGSSRSGMLTLKLKTLYFRA